MKISDIVNEVFDISKMKQVADIQKSIAKLNDYVAKNQTAAKDISTEPTQIGSNFQSILASMLAQQKQAEEEDKRKKAEEAAKAKLAIKSGIGTTVPIAPVAGAQQGTSQVVK